MHFFSPGSAKGKKDDDASRSEGTWWREMAEDDAKHMGDRVWWTWADPQPQYQGSGDPYITFMVTFVNATIFRLTIKSIGGETFYGREPLRDAPRFVLQEPKALVLNHGSQMGLLIRQPLSREVAFKLSEQKGRVTLDLSKVHVDFSVEKPDGMPGPDTFRLNGNEALVAIRG